MIFEHRVGFRVCRFGLVCFVNSCFRVQFPFGVHVATWHCAPDLMQNMFSIPPVWN